MNHRNRFFAVIVILCFILNCFIPVQAYALQNETVSSGQNAGQDNPVNGTDTQAGTGQAVQTINQSAGMTTGQAIGSTTSQAIGQTSEQAIGTTEQAIELDDGAGTPDGDETEANEPGAQTGDKNDGQKDNAQASDDESSWYSKKLPMKKEHQKLLWDYCKKRSLDYIDMLALIYTESNFNEKCRTGKYYGYFQISKGNCANLAKTMKTKNTPLDGAININWGTAMYSWILADKRVKGLEGKKKRDVALSIYQRGTGGYDKLGISKTFLKTFYKKRSIVCSYFGIDP